MNIPAITNPFWKHFSRYLLVGFSALFLFAISQQTIVGDFSHRGPQIASAYEVGECIQFSDGYWRFTGGDENDDANWVPCNSGNSDDGQVPPPPPPPPPPSCTENFRDYPQCGGTVGLESYPPTDTIIVGEWENTCTGSKRWAVIENKGNLGQCQQAAPPPVITPPPPSITPPPPVVTPPPPAPQPVPCPQPGQGGTVQQSQCGGQWTYNDYRITDRYSDGSPKTIYSEYTLNRSCQGTISCLAPTQIVTPPPPPTQRPECPVGGQSGTKILTDCGNQWGYDSCVAEGRYSNGAPRSYRCTFSGNNLCQGVIMCPEPATVTRQPAVLPPQGAPIIPITPVVVTNNNNNTNNNSNTNNNNITVSASAPRETVREVVRFTGNYGVAQPQVVTTQVAGVKELPKTGLPVAAWAALAFLPAGLRIRRFQKVKGHLENSPIYLWEKRQYNSHTENS